MHVFDLTKYAQLFSKVVPIYNLTSKVKELPLLYIVTKAWYRQAPYLYTSGGSKAATPCNLNLCFPDYC